MCFKSNYYNQRANKCVILVITAGFSFPNNNNNSNSIDNNNNNNNNSDNIDDNNNSNNNWINIDANVLCSGLKSPPTLSPVLAHLAQFSHHQCLLVSLERRTRQNNHTCTSAPHHM